MSSAQIASTATVGSNTTIGAFCVIGSNVSIGANCTIGNHVVIHAGTDIGNNVRIDDHASIGKQPMRAANSAVTGDHQSPPAHLKDGCIVGTQAVLYAGCSLEENVLVADMATVREQVTIGANTIVGRGVAIENQCTVGKNCKLETNAYITAYSTLADEVFVAPGVLTSNDNFMGRTEERFDRYGGVTVEQGGRLGVGAVVLPNKTVHAEAVVAAGAVLTRDAPSETVVAGVPAQKFGQVPEEQLLKNNRPQATSKQSN